MRILLLTLTLLLSSCGDMLPFSFGSLEGQEVAIPPDWSSVRDADVIQLESNPAEPYSVNLWVVEMNGHLHVHAGANRATWVENIEQDPRVRLGHNGSIYLLEGRRITDQAKFLEFAELWKNKYGNHPRNMNADEAYLFVLTPRGA